LSQLYHADLGPESFGDRAACLTGWSSSKGEWARRASQSEVSPQTKILVSVNGSGIKKI